MKNNYSIKSGMFTSNSNKNSLSILSNITHKLDFDQSEKSNIFKDNNNKQEKHERSNNI